MFQVCGNKRQNSMIKRQNSMINRANRIPHNISVYL